MPTTRAWHGRPARELTLPRANPLDEKPPFQPHGRDARATFCFAPKSSKFRCPTIGAFYPSIEKFLVDESIALDFNVVTKGQVREPSPGFNHIKLSA